MFSIQNVTKIYSSNARNNRIVALDDVSFKINDKEFVSIVGKSGAGKTTLLKLILAEEQPTKGNIFFRDQDIQKTKKSRILELRRKTGIVFQDYKLFPSKTVYENIAYVMEVMGATDNEIDRDVSQVLELVGLTNRAHSFPEELSGGEQQRTAIARAVIHRPEIVLADEPTGNLDPYNSFDIMQLLIKIYELGTTVVLATHDKELINSLGKRVVTLDQGKLIKEEERGRFIL
ncbi:MAG: cell division ATP-binding protein FtsE [Patescibacteria group bacterium]|nr:cell division ATP-binding protein FtsE [Patescibacteria group bacterium]